VILRDALRQSIERLDRLGITSPRLAAEVLLAHCLSVDRTYLYTHDEVVLNEPQMQCLEDSIWERASGTPVQYIVGRQEFFGRYFHVDPSVLIPRPETELLVERVLQLAPVPGSRIIDVGTGSGCIGITLALELPQTHVFQADVSLEAVQTAKRNAAALHATNTAFVCMDLLEATNGPFDFVVSNPPYVTLGETPRLQREVREHEPHVALFGGDDGLAAYRRLIPRAGELLTPGGFIVMEIGFGLEQGVLDLFGESWEKLPTVADLQGIPRIVSARRSS
jgi:release factor glutamine methyltransferase